MVTEMPPLTIDVEYDIRTREAKVTGTVKPELRREMLCDFLRLQTGMGTDNREAEEHDIYKIQVAWNPDHDQFTPWSDTGNSGLRDGILYDVVANHPFEADIEKHRNPQSPNLPIK